MNQEPRRQNQNTTAQRLRAMDRRWKREKRVLRLISLFLALVTFVCCDRRLSAQHLQK